MRKEVEREKRKRFRTPRDDNLWTDRHQRRLALSIVMSLWCDGGDEGGFGIVVGEVGVGLRCRRGKGMGMEWGS